MPEDRKRWLSRALHSACRALSSRSTLKDLERSGAASAGGCAYACKVAGGYRARPILQPQSDPQRRRLFDQNARLALLPVDDWSKTDADASADRLRNGEDA